MWVDWSPVPGCVPASPPSSDCRDPPAPPANLIRNQEQKKKAKIFIHVHPQIPDAFEREKPSLNKSAVTGRTGWPCTVGLVILSENEK